uniref:Uncharacterized protein n=1 Tax=Setaria digitata TaxID=48799 RepID=A0A915PVA8_9BILA
MMSRNHQDHRAQTNYKSLPTPGPAIFSVRLQRHEKGSDTKLPNFNTKHLFQFHSTLHQSLPVTLTSPFISVRLENRAPSNIHNIAAVFQRKMPCIITRQASDSFGT